MSRWHRRIFMLAAAAVFALATAAVWQSAVRSRALKAGRALAKSDTPEDVERLKEICSRHPRNAEMAFLLGVAYRRDGQRSKARKEFTRAEELGFSAEDLRREHYLMQFDMGLTKETAPQLAALLKQGCTDEVAEEIYECLVKGYVADLRLHEAMVCTDYWIEWRPKSVKARLARAFVLDMASEDARLTQVYREILDLDDTCVDAHLGLGTLLLEAKEVGKAKAEFEKCLALDPSSAPARLFLALSLRHLGDRAKSEKLLREALEGELTSEQQCSAYKELGQLAMERRDYQEAVQDARRAVELQPDDSEARYALGMVLTRAGDKQAADAELEKSRRLESLSARLTDLLGEIGQQPNDADARCEAGEILVELGHESQALACLLSAIRCDQNHVKTREALARFYENAGRSDIASRHLDWVASQAKNTTGNSAVGRPSRPPFVTGGLEDRPTKAQPPNSSFPAAAEKPSGPSADVSHHAP